MGVSRASGEYGTLAAMTQSQQRAFFTATDLDCLSVTTALVEGDVLSIAKDDHSLSLPISTAVDIAAETIRLLLDEDEITNGHGLSLSEWLSADDAEELRRILSKITGPEGPTFTTPHR
jgi:hypothetical protein